jgi:ParB family chromosome partitioning protein
MAINGVVEPLIVRPASAGAFVIVQGFRRWEAARMAGLTEAPVVVVEPDNPEEVGLLLQLHGEALCAVDEAEALAALADLDAGTDGALATRLGIHQSRISRARRIAGLDDATKALARERGIRAGVLAELAGGSLTDADRARLLGLPAADLTREAVRAAAAAVRGADGDRSKSAQSPVRRAHLHLRKAVDALLEDPAFPEAEVRGMTVADLLERTGASGAG